MWGNYFSNFAKLVEILSLLREMSKMEFCGSISRR